MNKEKNFVIYPEKQTTHTRKCDGCSKCCEGFLSADIYGFDMSFDELTAYLTPLLSKINELTPLKENGNNKRSNRWDED